MNCHVFTYGVLIEYNCYLVSAKGTYYHHVIQGLSENLPSYCSNSMRSPRAIDSFKLSLYNLNSYLAGLPCLLSHHFSNPKRKEVNSIISAINRVICFRSLHPYRKEGRKKHLERKASLIIWHPYFPRSRSRGFWRGKEFADIHFSVLPPRIMLFTVGKRTPAATPYLQQKRLTAYQLVSRA